MNATPAPVLVVDGHPDARSLTAALARSYAAGAGADADLLVLRDLAFDPSLRGSYRVAQPLEPDLVRARAALDASRHVVVLTPVWWGSVPSLLKGFFDRTLERGYAFRYLDSGRPQGLLTGRTGRLVVTADSPSWYLPLVGDTTVKQVKGRTLEFCGIKPVKVTRFTGVHGSTAEQRGQWLERCGRLGQDDAARLGARAPMVAGAA